MKKKKACFNKNCPAYRDKRYKESDENCKICGSPLFYICKEEGCNKQLPDDSTSAYCQLHVNERQDKKDNRHKTINKILSVAVAIGGTAVAFFGANSTNNKID